MDTGPDSSLTLDAPHKKPKPESGSSFKLWILAIIACLLAGGTGFWLTRDEADRQAMRVDLAKKLDSALQGTFLAGLGQYILPPEPPLSQNVIAPPTDEGTLSGRQILGTIAEPLDFGEATAAANYLLGRNKGYNHQGVLSSLIGFSPDPTAEQIFFNQDVLPPVTQDERIRPNYVSGLANWLATRYQPGPGGGAIMASVQSLNQECGGKLAGLAQGGRSGILRYAFHPTMINGLYQLYIQRFMEDLNNAATDRGLSEVQNRQFHIALAGHAVILANALEGALAVDNLNARLGKLDELAQKIVETNAELASAVSELDEQRTAKAGQQTINAAQMRVDGATARYRRATDDLAQAQNNLVKDLRLHAGQGLDAESLLFMASWIARREHQTAQAREALASCAHILRDFSARCRQIGENS